MLILVNSYLSSPLLACPAVTGSQMVSPLPSFPCLKGARSKAGGQATQVSGSLSSKSTGGAEQIQIRVPVRSSGSQSASTFSVPFALSFLSDHHFGSGDQSMVLGDGRPPALIRSVDCVEMQASAERGSTGGRHVFLVATELRIT